MAAFIPFINGIVECEEVSFLSSSFENTTPIKKKLSDFKCN